VLRIGRAAVARSGHYALVAAPTTPTPPDTAEARRRYRQLASGYDRHARMVAPLRRRAVERLKLRDGDHVLDMGCGTGASFDALRSIVGATGRVTGIELSEEMAAVACQRIREQMWANVEVIVADAATAPLPTGVDGVLFFETHDLLRTPDVVRRGVRAARAGGRVVAFGPASAQRWAMPLNAIIRAVARRYVTTFEGFDAPWSHLAQEVPRLRVHRLFLGAGYLAIGEVEARPESDSGHP
jgi:ubiquinone/menaquinone biosynthesis C-methylase UbiE